MKLVSVGELTIDHYRNLNRSFVGGISFNFAVQAKRCGAEEVSLVSRIGSDANGTSALARLSAERVDASRVAVLPGKTATCTIELIDGLERSYPSGGYHQNVLAGFELTAADGAFIQKHDVIVSHLDYSQSPALFNQTMVALDFHGKRIADFGDWSDYHGDHDTLIAYLDRLDIAFVSGTQAAIDRLLPVSRQVGSLIVVTLGAGGSAALYEGQLWFQPALAAPVLLDTTGCGDAFQAAFTVSYLRTGGIEQALASGAQQAAVTIQHHGATGREILTAEHAAGASPVDEQKR